MVTLLAEHPKELAKPRLRGVLHTWAFAVSIVAGAVLCSLTSSFHALAAALVYSLGMVTLFGTSATYHRVTWRSAATRAWMKRLDHSAIFVLVAATYTPFAALILSGRARVVVLSVAWGGALVGIIARMAWLRAPRWAIVPLYLALGWMAVFVMPQLLHRAGVAPVVLLAVGGVAYTLGAVAYASRRPNPSPEVFGYHEVFHALTLLAAASHFVAVLLAMVAVGAI